MPSHRFPFRNLYCLELRSFLRPVLMAGILMPASAQAQVSFAATPPSVNFGSQAIGSASSAQSLTFSIATGTTVGSIGVLTLGAANLDFATAAGSTCTATTYASTGNCTVNVIFKPTAAGLRMGAVVFFSGVNNIGTVLANVPIYGIGSGPQIAYSSGTVTIIDPTVNGEGLFYPEGVAVDGLGDLFIADSYQNRIVEVPASGGSSIAVDPPVNGEGLISPIGVAVDGAGDLFIVDAGHSRVVEMPAGGGTAVAIDPTGLSNPNSIAVDGAGDLFISNEGSGCVVEVPVGGGATIPACPVVNGLALQGAFGVAVDGAGDLFIVDQSLDRAVEVPPAAARPPPLTYRWVGRVCGIPRALLWTARAICSSQTSATAMCWNLLLEAARWSASTPSWVFWTAITEGCLVLPPWQWIAQAICS